MFSWLMDRIYGGAPEEHRPPKPDPEVETETRTYPIKTISATYQSGRTEGFESVRIEYDEGAVRIWLGFDVYSWRGIVRSRHEETKTIPYAALAEPLEETKIGEYEVDVESRREYEWKFGSWRTEITPEVTILNVTRVIDDEHEEDS